MTIRLAIQEDLPAIVDIYNSTISSRMVTADLTPVSVESREKWFFAHNSQTRPIFVKVETNRVIAWLSLQDFYGRSAYQHTAEISIYVDSVYRCQGIGSELLDFAIKKSPQLNIKTLLGFIFGHNQSSLNLFKKFGFENWGYLPKIAELDTIERDLIILGKRII
jgi:phosphinothricin acetyltransferase